MPLDRGDALSAERHGRDVDHHRIAVALARPLHAGAEKQRGFGRDEHLELARDQRLRLGAREPGVQRVEGPPLATEDDDVPDEPLN